MKNLLPFLISIFILLVFQQCKRHPSQSNSTAEFTTLPEQDPRYQYIKNYFLLSEQRELEKWYNTYLDKCKQFYKIEKPTRDSIINLIKSYWVTSDQQKHVITSIQWRPTGTGSEVFVTMNYSYRIIAEDRVRQIPKLKLQIILSRRNKVLSIKEVSRGEN